MDSANRRNQLDQELKTAVEGVTAVSEEEFLKCFKDAARGNVRLTSTTIQSLKNLHKLFISELQDKTYVSLSF